MTDSNTTTILPFPEGAPVIEEGVLVNVEHSDQQPELFYLFALTIYLLIWHRELIKAETAQLPANKFYTSEVLKHENVIYVIAQQMGISTHALAGFLQLHQDEIGQIIENAELLDYGVFVKKYAESQPESMYPLAEATTYYVWQRLGADVQEVNLPEWELLWQKVYRFFELTKGVEEVVPEPVQRDMRLQATALLSEAA